jgi:hypothetical protein
MTEFHQPMARAAGEPAPRSGYAGVAPARTRRSERIPTAEGIGHDFSGVAVHARRTETPAESRKRLASKEGQTTSGGDNARAISSTGTGTVTTSYVPEPGDKSTKIVFIQVMHETLDGVPTTPGKITPGSNYLDADTTSDFHHVDYTPGEKDPYYNGDDPNDFGPQGNAVSTPKVTASTHDSPNLGDASLPAGSTKVDWMFRTAAFSAAGEDAGTYYAYSDWAFQKQRGIASTTKLGGTRTGGPGSKFEAAVRLFNSNHGFKMPTKGASLLGGIVGGLLGAGAGALAGLAVGGLPGAVVGGIIGAIGGGLLGAFG